jgi:hypothetical protein
VSESARFAPEAVKCCEKLWAECGKVFRQTIYLWVIGGFIAAAALYGIYVAQRAAPPFVASAGTLCTILFLVLLCRAYLSGFGQPPFIKWRVKLTADEWRAKQEKKEVCAGLISDGERIGEEGEEACQFRCEHNNCGVYGPYLDHLPKGKYRAIFKIKVGRVLKKDQHLIRIDVSASRNLVAGDKELNHRDLSYAHFRQADTYYSFPVDFDISSDKGESDVEFRISPPERGPAMTLEYVQLSRRLF